MEGTNCSGITTVPLPTAGGEQEAKKPPKGILQSHACRRSGLQGSPLGRATWACCQARVMWSMLIHWPQTPWKGQVHGRLCQVNCIPWSLPLGHAGKDSDPFCPHTLVPEAKPVCSGFVQGDVNFTLGREELYVYSKAL